MSSVFDPRFATIKIFSILGGLPHDYETRHLPNIFASGDIA